MTLAWLGALAIGLSLGLLGSGGSILTVPVLVYLVGQEEKVAIGGSLLVVGAIAAVGGAQYALRRLVDWRTVLWFGLPGMVGTYGGAALARYVSGTLQLAVFALVMLTAAVSMLRRSPAQRSEGGGEPAAATATAGEGGHKRSRALVAVDGVAVGVLTGFVGVGGGFLIVPALTVLGGLPMPLAIGTSLVIIALKSFTGFAKYVEVLASVGLDLDWPVLLTLTAVGIVGSFAGRRLGRRMSEERLRRVFGLFLIVVGAWILWQSVPELL